MNQLFINLANDIYNEVYESNDSKFKETKISLIIKWLKNSMDGVGSKHLDYLVDEWISTDEC